MLSPFRATHRVWSYALTAFICAASAAYSSTASALVLDTFDVPVPLTTRVVTGAPGSITATVTLNEVGVAVPGGARDTTLTMYGNPLGSVAALAVGGGRISTAQGTGVTAETIVAYGAFTRVGGNPTIGGPLLALDLSSFKNLVLQFSGAEDVLNLNVVYYTSAPLNPGAPLYYASVGVNVAPSASGAPLTVKLPVSNNALFNWRRVDGIVVLINRSGPTPATSYTLDRLDFAP